MSSQNGEVDFGLYLYIFFSLLLALPLAVSITAVAFQWDVSPTVVASSLNISGSLLLIVVVVVDSMLAGAKSFRLLLFHTCWIVFGFLIVSLVLSAQYGSFLLGVFFFIHSLRSALPLWRGKTKWWHWSAWIRDGTVSVILFIWPVLLLA